MASQAVVTYTDASKALGRSQASLVAEQQRTENELEYFVGAVQERMAVLVEGNQQLQVQLVGEGARYREVVRLHGAEIQILQERVEAAERRILATSQERDATVARAEQQVARAQETRAQEAGVAAASLAAVQQELVLARQEIANARAEAAGREAAMTAERNAAVFAEVQRGEARAAVLGLEKEEMRVRHARLDALVKLEERDTCKMQKILGKLPTRNGGGSPRGRPFTIEVEKIQKLIDERLERSHDSVSDAALQETDTQKLVSFAAFITGLHNRRDEEPIEEILAPLIAARKARIR